MIKVAENQELAAKGIEVPIELGSPVTPVLMAKPANEHDHAYCGFCAPLRTVRHLAAAYARPQGPEPFRL